MSGLGNGPWNKGYEPSGININSNLPIYECGFNQGYEQAEKDLALTWEDMREITRIDIEMMDDPEEHPEWTEEKSFYEEVLRRFMQIKEARK